LIRPEKKQRYAYPDVLRVSKLMAAALGAVQ